MDEFIPKVTLLQLEKMYGKSSDGKNFIQELIKGLLDMNVFDVNPWLYWSQWEIQDYKIFLPRPEGDSASSGLAKLNFRSVVTLRLDPLLASGAQ